MDFDALIGKLLGKPPFQCGHCLSQHFGRVVLKDQSPVVQRPDTEANRILLADLDVAEATNPLPNGQTHVRALSTVAGAKCGRSTSTVSLRH